MRAYRCDERVGIESVAVLATRQHVETQNGLEGRDSLAELVANLIDLEYRIEPFHERLRKFVVDLQVLGESTPCVLNFLILINFREF